LTKAALTARILIADDHPLIRLAVRRELEDAGFEVCGEARDGPSAVADAVRAEPDLCVLDVQMPGDGIAAAREITRRLPGTKVVLLTTGADERDMLDAIVAGASGYLGKETEPARLSVALRAVLRGEVAVPRSFVSALVDRLRAAERR
jgi:DNA-binding NarL/FixJ family response regulator